MTAKSECSSANGSDAYSPEEMACRARTVGVAKAKLDCLSTFMLAVLAGAFIGLGACFYTLVVTGSAAGFGITRLLGGVVFSLGLILVVIAGAELFTGNTLIVIATVSRRVSTAKLLRNWAIVYVGNFVGSVATAAIVYYAWQWKAGNMAVGVTAYNVAAAKMSIPFVTAVASGVMCNVLVCLAVWLCFSARSSVDKILSIVFPISAFVACGFEHCVANMYFIPYGMMLASDSAFTSAAEKLSFDPSVFTMRNFLIGNLVPVTLGNIIGGAVFVGLAYWIIYLRGSQEEFAPVVVSESEELTSLHSKR